MKAAAEKFCAVCGRRMVWRRRWGANWEHVRYCSQACRQRGIRTVDRRLEAVMLALLQARGTQTSICPSEPVRAVAHHDAIADWQALMPAARMAARRLVAQGRAEIIQHGRPVDASTARGAIRIRLRAEGV
jgi:hypothetical protein